MMDLPSPTNLVSKVNSSTFPLILLVRNKTGEGSLSGGGASRRRRGPWGYLGLSFCISRLPYTQASTGGCRGLLQLPTSTRGIHWAPVLPGSPDAFISQSSHMFSLCISPRLLKHLNSRGIRTCNCLGATDPTPSLCKEEHRGTEKGRRLPKIPQEARGKAGTFSALCSQYAAHPNTPGSLLRNQSKPGT